MSELEPTRTEHEPTATERLRALLDERGVEYRCDNGTATWYVDGVMYNAWGRDNERLTMSVCHLTTEQAIAATLGDSDATGERQRDAVEVVRCRDCERFAVDQSDHEYRSGWWCKRWYTDMVKPDGFCAWGVRRESE